MSVRMAGDGEGSFGAVIPDAASDRSWTFTGIPICVEPRGEAIITQVRPRDGDNLEAVGFATGPGTMDLGADFVDLHSGGFDLDHRTVAASCDRGHTELALELRRGQAPAPGISRGFTVSYRSAAGKGEMEVPFHVTLCPAETLDLDCAPSTG